MRAEEQVTEDRHELDFGSTVGEYRMDWSAEAAVWVLEVLDRDGDLLGKVAFPLPKDALFYVTIGSNCLVVVFQRICPS